MSAPQTVAVMEALGTGRFVGGAVRNALLGAPVSDIDIAVPIPPTEAMARLQAKKIQVAATGITHGTIMAIIGSHVFEITSLRLDVSTDGRHARVAFTDDWAQDAARRDFTINALYASRDGEIFDYANGVADLMHGRIRFVGDAKARIAEDYLRILRLFRFQAWYGKGEIDPEALGAAAQAKEKLKTLSAERISKELLRLIAAPKPGPVLRIMAATSILSQLLPGTVQLGRLERLSEIDAEYHFASDPMLRLAALIANDVQDGCGVADALKLSNQERKRLREARSHACMSNAVSAKQARVLLYRLGVEAFKDKVFLAWAAMPKGANNLQWRMLLEMADNWQRPHLALGGLDVIEAGVPEGPQVGKILARLEEWWAQGDFSADEAEQRNMLKTMIETDPSTHPS